jgi:uncharacterized membrane protein
MKWFEQELGFRPAGFDSAQISQTANAAVAFLNSISTRQEVLVTTEEAPRVPHHVEDAVATIAALHAAHHREARALQKAISRTSGIAQPGTLILITLAIAIWVTLNLALPEFGRAALDPFPFLLLATIVSTIALYLAAMIQRHDDEMATRREQITLELAILSEQKSSKGGISAQRPEPR